MYLRSLDYRVGHALEQIPDLVIVKYSVGPSIQTGV